MCQDFRGLHLPNTLHGNTEATATVALFGELIPFPKRHINVKDAMDRSVSWFVGERRLGILEVFEYKSGTLLAVADATGI